MPRKKEWVKLHGQMFMNMRTGDVRMHFGEGAWFKQKIGNVEGTKAHKMVVNSYGTKSGRMVRKKVAVSILKRLGVR